MKQQHHHHQLTTKQAEPWEFLDISLGFKHNSRAYAAWLSTLCHHHKQPQANNMAVVMFFMQTCYTQQNQDKHEKFLGSSS